MTEQNATYVLQKLVELANKANTSNTAIAMEDVFDGTQDTNEWLETWNMAQAVVAKSP